MSARDSFLEKAAQCRRLAAGLLNANEPAKPVLIALAEEFEHKAARLEIEDRLLADPAKDLIPQSSEVRDMWDKFRENNAVNL